MATITWIEDDHEIMGSLVELLRKDGHVIKCYASWEQVNQNLSAVLECDAIILDVILPPISDDPYMGLFILEELNKNDFNVPIVVCSRVQNPVVLERMKDFGVKTILRKPVRPTQLYNAVVEVLDSG